tara:strand:+ start:210 stop:668 length:459 start_codon:yes stop_codon:yes gene_type:complete
MLTRDFTATTFVVHEDRVLLLWHNKLQMWLPPGGHIADNELPEVAAKREVFEETGLNINLLGKSQPMGNVILLAQPHCLLLEDIEPGHQHIDFIFFAEIESRHPKIHLNEKEAEKFEWYDSNLLAQNAIAEDVRNLGRVAIESVKLNKNNNL